MIQTTYNAYPDSAAGAAQALYPFLVGQTSGSIGAASINEDTTTTLGDTSKGVIRDTAFIVFDFGLIQTGPPVGSFVISGLLQLTASVTDSTLVSAVIGLMLRDGSWNLPLTSGYGLLPTAPSGIQAVLAVYNAAGTAMADTGAGLLQLAQDASEYAMFGPSPIQSNGTPWPNGNGPYKRNEIGQSLQISGTTGALTSGVIVIRKPAGGSPTSGNMRMKVSACAANDGSNDHPTGSVLAFSDWRTAVGLPAGTGGTPIPFTFSGPNQITLVSGNRYAFVVEGDSSFNGRLIFGTLNNWPFSGGRMMVGTSGFSLYEASYPNQYGMPHPFFRDGSVHTPYFASNPAVQMPSFVAGTTYSFDVTSLLQQWINDPSYNPNSVLGFALAVPGSPGNNSRVFSGQQLLVQFGIPETMSGLISGEVLLGPSEGTRLAFSGLTSGEALLGPSEGTLLGFGSPVSGEALFASSGSTLLGYGSLLSGEALLGTSEQTVLGYGATLSGEALLATQLGVLYAFAASVSGMALLSGVFSHVVPMAALLSGEVSLLAVLLNCNQWFATVAEQWFAPALSFIPLSGASADIPIKLGDSTDIVSGTGKTWFTTKCRFV